MANSNLTSYRTTYATSLALDAHHILVQEGMDEDLAWIMLEVNLPEAVLFDLDTPTPTPQPPWID